MEPTKLPRGRELFTDIRYPANQRDVRRYTTDELRSESLVENLYVPDEVVAVYSHVDRVVTLGCVLVWEALPIDKGIDAWANFGTEFFLGRREIGIFNIGGAGVIEADGRHFSIGCKDCPYITMSIRSAAFSSENETNPAKFFMVSAPAHCVYETTFIGIVGAVKKSPDSLETANKKVINQFIHPDVLKACQFSMGLTILEPGSVQNTMPIHTHERRMEIYTYTGTPKDNVVFHSMGSPTEAQHLVMQNEQAVISPSWSIHSSCGTPHYSFIWAMGGENQAFDDMDTVDITAPR